MTFEDYRDYKDYMDEKSEAIANGDIHEATQEEWEQYYKDMEGRGKNEHQCNITI